MFIYFMFVFLSKTAPPRFVDLYVSPGISKYRLFTDTL